MRIPLALCLVLVFSNLVLAQSPYAGEQARDIKAISAERVAALEAGRGLGYAKAAELNGHPGPMHVLDLADELELDADQRRRTQALFKTMRERAAALARELIRAEAELDQAFAEGSISRQRLLELVSASARIESEIRLVHLQAHVEQAELLRDSQIAAYKRLRGYGDEQSHEAAHHGHQGH